MSAEILLWRCVVYQAIRDLNKMASRTSVKINAYKAENWLNANNQDFVLTCHLAQLNPQWVLKNLDIIKKIMKNNVLKKY
jgi:hypothetical protein